MTDPNDLDPIEMLGAVNPIDQHSVPSASLARVSARTQESVMSDLEPVAGSSRRTLSLLGGIAAIGAIALVVVVSAPRAGDLVAVVPTASAATPGAATPIPATPTAATPSADPTVGQPNVGGGAASCIRYDTAILAGMMFGFDGTVTAVDGDQITFLVNKSYKGVKADRITLTTPGGGLALDGTIDLVVGDRYLVSGFDKVISSCGYTQVYDPAVAAEWKTAFGD